MEQFSQEEMQVLRELFNPQSTQVQSLVLSKALRNLRQRANQLLRRWSKPEDGYRAQGESAMLERLERLPEEIKMIFEEERKVKELKEPPTGEGGKS